jgi:iron complex transport system substrate-binding protein
LNPFTIIRPTRLLLLRILSVVFLWWGGLALADAPQRVISLAPNITELVFAIGAGDSLVGVAAHSDYPDAAKHIPVISDYHALNIERILALRPDVIVYWPGGVSSRHIDQLKRLGFRLVALNPQTLTDIPKALIKLGTVLGRDATVVAKRFQEQLAALLPNSTPNPRPTVFVQVWDNPLMTLNRDNILSDMIDKCGGTHLFAELVIPAPSVSYESVLAANPDVILVSHPSQRQGWLAYPFLNAVKKRQIYYINPDYTSRATPRVLKALGEICGVVTKN